MEFGKSVSVLVSSGREVHIAGLARKAKIRSNPNFSDDLEPRPAVLAGKGPRQSRDLREHVKKSCLKVETWTAQALGSVFQLHPMSNRCIDYFMAKFEIFVFPLKFC